MTDQQSIGEKVVKSKPWFSFSIFTRKDNTTCPLEQSPPECHLQLSLPSKSRKKQKEE